AEDKKQARAALLPSVSGFSQYIYTQANGTPSGIFVPNDGPRVYAMWLNVHGDVFSLSKWAEYRGATAAEAVARAKADVAGRGLVATIVQNYYGLVAAQRKLASAQQGLREAQQFLDITKKQESGGEVAHSDVVKAQIQVSQRTRDAQDAELAALKSRLGLSVLIFPDFRDTFTVADDLQTLAPLLPLEELKSSAVANSPDVKAAEASVQQERLGIDAARGGVLPSVSFDYFYGINANEFATHSAPTPENPSGVNLLGSVAQVQLNVPLWTWGAAQSKMKQAQLRVQAARSDLTLAQRQLQASVSTFHREAEIARDQVASLRESLDLSTESLRLTLLRYQAGEVSVLEVVDAQTTLIQARNAYDDGLVRYRVALAALQTLTGTL
ncbi:MAG TPA: TolC family protein, partial [Vicinamibacterales bacterium]|nr:TolC family protein [Vicinamibacterales bacterium]